MTERETSDADAPAQGAAAPNGAAPGVDLTRPERPAASKEAAAAAAEALASEEPAAIGAGSSDATVWPGADASVDYGDYEDFALMADPLTDRLPPRPVAKPAAPRPTPDADAGSGPAPDDGSATDGSGDDETILIDGRSFRGSGPPPATPPATLPPATPPATTPPATAEPAAPELVPLTAPESPQPTPPRAAVPEPPAPVTAPEPFPPAGRPVGDKVGAKADAPTDAPADAAVDVTGDGAEGPVEEPSPAAGLRGLIAALRTRRARGTQLVIALLCGLLGFFAVVQVRLQAQDNTLRTARQSDLIRILDDLNDRNDRLESEIRDLGSRRDELQFGTDRSQAALQEAEQRRATLGILAGTVPTHGPGITLRITDPGKKVDAAVLLDTLQELRDAGAEAVQIGDVRVVAGTDFLDVPGGGRVRIDGRIVTAPYVFKVIGDPDTLDPALRIPGGVFAVLDERGATPSVDAKRTVVIDAVRPAQPPQYARPAPNSG